MAIANALCFISLLTLVSKVTRCYVRKRFLNLSPRFTASLRRIPSSAAQARLLLQATTRTKHQRDLFNIHIYYGLLIFLSNTYQLIFFVRASDIRLHDVPANTCIGSACTHTLFFVRAEMDCASRATPVRESPQDPEFQQLPPVQSLAGTPATKSG
jgi:hypothetical protein